MSILNEPIDLGDVFQPPVLVGVGLGVAASFYLFKTPSILQLFGLSFVGGLGGYVAGSGSISQFLPSVPDLGAINVLPPVSSNSSPAPASSGPGLPTLDLPSLASQIVKTVDNIVHPTGGTTVTSTTPTGNTLSAKQAYDFIKQGRYAQVRLAKISRYYTWKDVFEPILSPVGASRVGQVSLDKLQNAVNLALQLDILCDRTGGKKIAINSWIRIQTKSSNHTTGAAADLGASFAYCNNVIKPAARTIPGIKGIGYPTKTSQNAIHIDILANHGCIASMQYVFVDNGDGQYSGSCQPVITQATKPTPAPAPAPKKPAPVPAPKVIIPVPIPQFLLPAPPPKATVQGTIIPGGTI